MFTIEFLVCSILLFVLYYLFPQIRKWLLLVISAGFYFLMGVKQFVLLFTMIVISYLFVRELRKTRKKGLMITGVIISLLPLFTFKYLGFVVSNASRIFGFSSDNSIISVSFITPLGISFISFKMISTVVDVYKKEKYIDCSFVDYAIYIMFMPSVVSGPIDRAELFIPQIKEDKNLSYDNFSSSFLQIIYGLGMKMLIADKLARIVNCVYGTPESYKGFPIFVTGILYAIEIYADFAGYTNIALGFAKMLGFNCMDNFLQPYLANSIKDFWRRWHVSLSTWLRDYVYIPLGGNRKGKIRKYINVMITFLVSGIWHGASWNFVIWGGLHGAYQVIGDIKNDFISILFPRQLSSNWKANKDKLSKFKNTLHVMITFILVDFAWVLFASESFTKAIIIYKNLFNRSAISFDWIFESGISATEVNILLMAIIVLLVVDILKEKGKIRWENWGKQNVVLRFVVLYLLIFTIIIVGIPGKDYNAQSFIYFNF